MALTPHALAQTPQVGISCHSVSSTAKSHPPRSSADGGWYRFRRDKQLSGRSGLVGWMTCPEVLWRQPLNGRGQWLELEPSDTSSTVPLVHSGFTGDPYGIQSRFNQNGATLELPGNGEQINPNDSAFKIGDFDPHHPGLEMATCEPGWAEESWDGSRDMPCYLLNWSGSSWNVIWRSEDLPYMSENFSASTPLVADVDADGKLEIVVSTWYFIHVLDLQTGELEATGEFISPEAGLHGGGRPYGWLGTFNLDDDDALEIVILADFLPFISVLDWDAEGNLFEAWDWQIEETAGINESYHLVTANAVSDVTGDGKPNLVANVYNGNGDNRWHLLIFDPATGTVLFDLEDRHAEAVQDLDNDGTSEILATKTSGRLIHEDGPAILFSFQGGEQNTLYQSGNQSWHWSNIADFPAHIHSAGTLGMQHPTVLLNWSGQHAVIVSEQGLAAENVRLRFFALESGNVVEIAQAEGPNLAMVGTDEAEGAGTFALRATFSDSSAEDISLANLSMVRLGARGLHRGDGPLSVFNSLLGGTVVLPQADQLPLIVTEGSGQRILAFNSNPSDPVPELVWQTDGRGMYSGVTGVAKTGMASVLGFKPLTNGMTHVAVARKGADSGAAIAVLKSDGSVLWERAMQTQSPPPSWNYPGVTHWMAGNFRHPDREDLYVVIRRGNMLDDTGYMLDGRTGDLIWSKKHGAFYTRCDQNPPSSWYQGGPNAFHATASDWDGDSLDDIFDHTNATLAVYEGSTGQTLINRWAAETCTNDSELMFEEPWSSNQVVGTIMTPRFGAEPYVLMSMNKVTLAALQLNGTLKWYTPLGSGFTDESLVVGADLNGDGNLEVVTVNHCGTPGFEIRSYDLTSGEIRWTLSDFRMCADSPAQSPVAADLDGDGRDEILAVSGSRLVAYAESLSGEGVKRWEIILNGDPDIWQQALGTPVIADINGTGGPEILLNTASGYLIALGTNDPAPLNEFQINAGLNDAWFNPTTAGQGFFITVFPQIQRMFLAWFTYDTNRPPDNIPATIGEPGHRWLTAFGEYSGSVATLAVELTRGGVFDTAMPEPTQSPDGTISLDFQGCNSATLRYDLNSIDMQGEIRIERIALDNIPGCEAQQ